ncbi:hypothetical protein [Kroppenstedtia sanguinis]|uniref:DUF3592 domain-containing protein n=1 Tax=Kroppenstedtia sanguinis TaxID=1380684 RepID=A0ABW4CCB3_9BACL
MPNGLLIVSFICALILIFAIVKVIKGMRKAKHPILEILLRNGIYEFTIPDKGWYNISLQRRRKKRGIMFTPPYKELNLFNQSSRQPQKLIPVFWNETRSSLTAIQQAHKLFIVKDDRATHYRLEVKGADPAEDYRMIIHGSFLPTAIHIPILVLSALGMFFSLAYAILPL